MGLALGISNNITISVRCSNCFKEGEQQIAIPDYTGGKIDLIELQDCGVLDHLRFHCERCDSVIGQIAGARPSASVER